MSNPTQYKKGVLSPYNINGKYKTKYNSGVIDWVKAGNNIMHYGTSMLVTRATVNAWRKKYQAFSDAYDVAHDIYAMSLDLIADDIMTGELRGNAQMAQFIMKNRISEYYKDKTEVEQNGNSEIVVQVNYSQTPASTPTETAS
jgi:hypothetical protein